MEKYASRADVPEKYKWDLSDFYKDEADFNEAYERASKDVDKIKNYVGCTKDINKLKAYIDFDINLASICMDLQIYGYTMYDQDLSVSKNREILSKADELYNRYASESAFFNVELLSLSKDEYKFIISDKTMKKYVPYLDQIFRRKDHILSEKEEKLVCELTKLMSTYEKDSMALLNSYHDYGTVTLEDGSKEQVMLTNYRKLMKKLPRDKRKKLYKQFNRVLDQYAEVNASYLNNYVKTNESLSKIYGFSNTWERKLFELNLSDKVFDSLVNSAIKRKDVIKKYYDLKAKTLKLDKLMPWDSALELYKIDKDYTIEEAKELCLNATKVLGKEYQEKISETINGKHIDFCQYKGKCSGGYCISGLDKKYPKILMSFNDDLNSVSTLAHEGGHHVHHQFIFDNNDALYRYHDVIVCEVASLTNECLLSNYLLNNGTKEEALAGLSNIIGVFMNNFFGAIQEGDLERDFYKYVLEGGTITKESMYDLTEKSILKFMPGKSIKDKYQKCSWITRSHYYVYFYLFSYSICISVAMYVANEILNGNKEMLDKYIKYLSTGSTLYPKDLFKILDIDLEDEKVYMSAIDYFDKLLDKFDEVYKEV